MCASLCKMAANCVVIITVLCLLCVKGDLELEEGASCVTAGVAGDCTAIYKCPSALFTYTYRNAGFSPNDYDFPELPDICSYKNNYPVVCCTDCFRYNDTKYKDATVNAYGNLIAKTGKAAEDRCADYFQNLPYPCRGTANFRFKNIWNETRKCHNNEISLAAPVGGRDAEKWEFPHMALLGYGGNVESAQWLCGGTVISEKFILTAGHCIASPNLGSIKFAALGLLKRTEPKETWKIYNIKRIVTHPEYKSPSKYHDIALLETETEINFGRDLLPACLDTAASKKYSAEASGWGSLGHRKPLADNLQVVVLNVYEQSECFGIYPPQRLLELGYDHEKQMCYGSKTKIVDTCQGDSGGPLQSNIEKCQYSVIGVTSFGKNCGILGSAGMYTRVSYYVPWIESIVWPSSAT